MYHKENLIWSSKPNTRHPEYTCGFSLQRDGNAVLYRENSLFFYSIEEIVINPQWDSQTNFNPTKTELRLEHQQLQIVQTFKDGTERLFYVDAENQEFREDMGEPRKIANRFILKKTQDEDKTILRRNEYIGDLDGTHLILQSNCQLQLRHKNITLWSFASHFSLKMSCVLNTDEKGQIAISRIINKDDQRDFYAQRITQFDDEYSDIFENWIMFEDDQPMIIQTLKNGSEVTYTSGLGLNNGLKPQRKPRKLAEKTLNIKFQAGNNFYTIERMDYIGNLTGLHLILQQNCSLLLINGNQRLWELQPNLHNDPLMDCLIRFDNYGKMVLEREYSSFNEGGFHILTASYDSKNPLIGYQLTLENNQLIVTRQLTNRAPEIFIAGPNIQGSLFQIISEGFVMVSGDDKEDLVLPKMGLGDISGVYAIFEDNCNWVLYNKTEVIWESGTSRKEFERECELILMRNGGCDGDFYRVISKKK